MENTKQNIFGVDVDSETKLTYAEFIRTIGNGFGFHQFLRDLSEQFEKVGKEKWEACKANNYQGDSGQGWKKDAKFLYGLTDSRKMPVKVYQHLAKMANWNENCKKSNNEEWAEKSQFAIDAVMSTAPSGSGIDCGTKLIKSSPTKLQFQADYHHMDDNGYYDGWTEHRVTVWARLDGFALTISGSNRNEIKDYLHEVFNNWLNSDFDVESGRIL